MRETTITIIFLKLVFLDSADIELMMKAVTIDIIPAIANNK